MKRLLTFSFSDEKYVIQEETNAIFEIDIKDMKFDSLIFYNNVYGDGKSTLIDFKNELSEDRVGKYIFKWLSEIIAAISSEFNEQEISYEEETWEVDEEVVSLPTKTIHLYDIATCAGNGTTIDSSDATWTEYLTNNMNADYAARISGKSMEPGIPDGSIVLVKRTRDLNNKDIGIFIINGESTCKRYIVKENKKMLTPDNESDDYKIPKILEDDRFDVQGKVIEVISI